MIIVGSHILVVNGRFGYWGWLLLGVNSLIVFACWGISIQVWGAVLGFIGHGLIV